MIDKVRRTVEQYHMLEMGDRLVIGVSGGADSVALLMTLLELRQEYELELAVVHVNHQLREEADVEEAYVQELCSNADIPCLVYRRDIAAYARERSCSVEDAGRSFRYECFATAAQEMFKGRAKVAVAHHRNDRVETMVFHMVRGTGLKGLRGIPPIRVQSEQELLVIRPLYQVERQEIEQYLLDRDIRYYIDASNASNEYSRNRIRNQVIPELITVNQQAVSHMVALSEQAMEYWNYVEEQAIRFEQEHGIGDTLELTALLEQPDLLQRHIIYRWLVRESGHAKDWEEKHVRMVQKLAKKQGEKVVHLPYQMQAVHSYHQLILRREHNTRDFGQKYICKSIEPILISSECELQIDERWSLNCRLLSELDADGISKKTYTKMLDYDTISGNVYLRNPDSEDYMIVNRQGSHKKLSRIFIDEKIPREVRQQVLILATGHQVIWIPGIRISEDVKVTDATGRILRIEVREKGTKHDEGIG